MTCDRRFSPVGPCSVLSDRPYKPQHKSLYATAARIRSLVTHVKNFNDEVGETGGIHDRLWTVGSIHPAKRAPAVTAQETS